MKLFFIFIALFVFGKITAQPYLIENRDKEVNFYDIKNSYTDFYKSSELKRGIGLKPYLRWEYFWEERVYPSGKFPNGYEILNSYNQFVANSKEINDLLDNNFEWKELGPFEVPTNKLVYNSSGLGRLNVVRIHPSDDNIIWVGSAGGGAWISTNKGQSWSKSDFTDILSIGVSDIAFAPSNPEIMYLATGDKNGSFMTNEYSVGILKSTNSGKTWDLVTQKYNPTDYFLASKILVHPLNPDIVIVGTSRHIIKSLNGGKTWENVLQSSSMFRDLEFNPTNPQIIYASNSNAIFKSIDEGKTWVQVFIMSGGSRIELAVTPNDSKYVYAIAARGSAGSFLGLAKSIDEGSTFSMISTSPNIFSIEANGTGSSGQGNYDLAFSVSPADKDLIFAGGIHTWKSTNGGLNWKILNHWTGSYNLPYVHADQHYTSINPRNLELFAANDGGLYLTKDNGVNWTDLSSGLAISQFYRINVSPANPNMIIGGTQDNGTFLLKDNKWYHVNGGDGMDCAIDPLNDNNVYATTQYGNLFKSTTGGFNFNRIAGPDMFQNESANWITPFALNPKNPSSIYVGYRNIYKSTNKGASWFKLTSFSNTPAIRVLEISESDTNIIYIGVNSVLYKSSNGGKTFSALKTFPSYVTDIAIDPTNPDRAFITLSGYTKSDRVYEINGTEIKNITFNLPNIPASAIVVQKSTSGRLFIGTDIGVFTKFDDFTNEWILFNKMLPPAVVSDLKINYSSGKLYAGTYGRGIWEVKLYDCEIEKPEILVKGNLEFCSGDSVLLEAKSKYDKVKWSTGDTSKSIIIKKSGTYFVSVKSENECTNKSEPINVVEMYVPSFSIRSNKEMVLCGLDTISLSVQIGFKDYKWSTGDTTNRITVTEPGYYKVSALSNNGCHVNDSAYIYMRPVPDIPRIDVDGDNLATDSAYAYKWYVDDNEVPNSNSRTIIAGKSGNYYVVVYNEFGCGTKSANVGITSFVDDYKLIPDIIISPNPISDYIRLKSNTIIDQADIIITDILGRTIIEDKIINFGPGNEIVMNLPNLSPGNYLILLKFRDKILTKKIIKYN